jgi:hypothetical protein
MEPARPSDRVNARAKPYQALQGVERRCRNRRLHAAFPSRTAWLRLAPSPKALTRFITSATNTKHYECHQ